ncbi:MAG: hypothetical protein GY821_16670 [Gammaproteobacteria bacterium]|nr:hypothetical protein [Gammaproteobacteria bacterium]
MKNGQFDQPMRYDFLDNLKWVLTILVILHHAAATAGLDPIGFNLPKVSSFNQWQYKLLNSFQGNNQSFFMGVFSLFQPFLSFPRIRRKGQVYLF